MAGGRFLIAGSILFFWARARGAPFPTRAQWRAGAMIGALLFLLSNGALTWSEQRVPTGLAALLLSVIPLWMVLIHQIERRGKDFGPRLVAGLVLGVGGIVVLVGPSQLLGGGRVDTVGALVLLGGSLSWSIGSLRARRAALPPSPIMAASLEMLTGGAFLVILGIATGELQAFRVSAVSARSVFGVSYLIAFGSLVGFTSYNWLLGHTTPARVATYAYVNPVIAVFLGWIVAGESLTARTVVAAVVIVSAVVLIISHPSAPAPGKISVTRIVDEAAASEAPVS